MKKYTSSGWVNSAEHTAKVYGVLVDTEEPIVGVIANNDIGQWISDVYPDAIDLGWEAAIEEYKAEHGPDAEPGFDETDGWESDGPYLVGDWMKGADGLWVEDRDEEHGFAAIINEVTTQVIWSLTTTRAAHCSPCYPGQGDIGSDGEFLTFTLPADCFDGDAR